MDILTDGVIIHKLKTLLQYNQHFASKQQNSLNPLIDGVLIYYSKIYSPTTTGQMEGV